MTMEHKTFSAFVTKVEEDKGIVEAIVAVMGNVDQGDDIIHSGAFTKTLVERMGKIRVLDNHRTDSVMAAVGVVLAAKEVGKSGLPAELKAAHPDAVGGLFTRTQYLIDTPEGLGVFKRIKANAIGEYSIGYDALDYDHGKVKGADGRMRTVRNLRTVKLYEFSPVLFGMNDATMTSSVKNAEAGSEKKPWDVFKEGDKWCVHKLAADGSKGPMVPGGCHSSESDANSHLAALHANVSEGKSINLTERIEEVSNAFRAQYSMPGGMAYDCWVREVYDDYIIVCMCQMNSDMEFYQVGYSVNADGSISFAPMVQWVEGDYVFVPDASGVADEGEMSTMAKALKAGRVLNARNAARIGRIMQELQDVMKEAGLYSANGEDKPDKPNKSADDKSQAGSGADASATPSTPEQMSGDSGIDLKSLTDLELAELDMLVKEITDLGFKYPTI